MKTSILEASQQRRLAPTKMASHHSSHSYNDARYAPLPASHTNVLAFPNRRVLLLVTLACKTHDSAQDQLRSLFHSPLGVYVVDAQVAKGQIKVRFDIAANDIDFILHTLITDLPEAIIGPLEPKTFRHANSDLKAGAPLQIV